MDRNARRAVLVATIAVVVALIPSVAHAAVTGALTQLASPNDCIQPDSATNPECGTSGAKGLFDAQDLAASPDGKNVYVAARGSGAVAEFTRNADGSLTQLSAPNDCVSEFAQGCGTTGAKGLQQPVAIIVSPDGKNVYVLGTEGQAGAIAEFTRNADGSLTQLASPDDCIEEHGGSGCGTTTGHGIARPSSLAISPDGKNVYVTDSGRLLSDPGAVAEFSRDPSTGALSQLTGADNCIQAQRAATGNFAPALAVIQECATTGSGLTAASRVIVSSDGKNVYTGSDRAPGAIAEFTRDAGTGALTQLSSPNNCIEEQGAGDKECGTQTALGIDNLRGLAGSPDGSNVYSVSRDPGAIGEFSRDGATGVLTQLASPNNCIEEHGSASPLGCGSQTGHGVFGGSDIKVSPDGQSVYAVTSSSNSPSALVELARNRDGSLTQLASPNDCIEEHTDPAPDCGNTSGHGITNPFALTISPDGANVYVAAGGLVDPVAEFSRVLPPAPPSPPVPAPSATPQSTPASTAQPPAKTAVKARKVKKHHKKHKKVVRRKRVIRRPAPTFTG